MEYKEAKERFIETWGVLGSQWGVNKTIAQIQALLLVAPEPMSTDEIMEELTISRGNANMSLRQLLDWGIIYKKTIAGERKEYFVAEKDVWKWSHKIGQVRKQRELHPVLDLLDEIDAGKKDLGNSVEEKEFAKQIKDLNKFTHQVSGLADQMFSSKGEFLLKLIKMFLK